jgi:2-hydroxy-3-keto-5-methylthiopentenyl-1-phosphate phosphatase
MHLHLYLLGAVSHFLCSISAGPIHNITLATNSSSSSSSPIILAPITNPELFLDFDSTIAISDAFRILPTAAYASPLINPSLPGWDHYKFLYHQSYNFASGFHPQNRTVAEELAFQHDLLLRKAEEDHFNRIKESGMFDTIEEPLLLEHAGGIQFRRGFWELVKEAKKRGVKISVISRNLSTRWLRHVLRVHDPADLSEEMPIYALEVLPDGILKPGKEGLDRPRLDMHSGDDKRNVIREMKEPDTEVVFVGDANSDLPPVLMEPAVIGVAARIWGKEERIVELVEGDDSVELWRLGEGWKGPGDGVSGVYYLEDFDEVQAILGW